MIRATILVFWDGRSRNKRTVGMGRSVTKDHRWWVREVAWVWV